MKNKYEMNVDRVRGSRTSVHRLVEFLYKTTEPRMCNVGFYSSGVSWCTVIGLAAFAICSGLSVAITCNFDLLTCITCKCCYICNFFLHIGEFTCKIIYMYLHCIFSQNTATFVFTKLLHFGKIPKKIGQNLAKFC